MRRKMPLILLLLAALAVFGLLNAGQETAFMWLRSAWAEIDEVFMAHPYSFTVCFMLLHIMIVGLFIPAAAVMLLAAGAIYGPIGGIAIASAGNITGAVLAFLLSRHFLYRRIARLYAQEIARLHALMNKDGWFYLLLVRLTPLFPAAAVNLMAGVLPIRLRTFIAATVIGNLPIIAFHAWLGTRLLEIDSLHELVSLPFIGAMLALATLLAVCKWMIGRASARNGQMHGAEKN